MQECQVRSSNVPAGLPAFAMEEAEEPVEPDAVFFSRNFLLMFEALNRFGWGATGVNEDVWT